MGNLGPGQKAGQNGTNITGLMTNKRTPLQFAVVSLKGQISMISQYWFLAHLGYDGDSRPDMMEIQGQDRKKDRTGQKITGQQNGHVHRSWLWLLEVGT